MARIDHLKEEIGWLKVVFGVLSAVDLPLVGWLAQNDSTASPLLVIPGFLLGVVLSITVVRLNAVVYHRLRQLEDA